VMTPTLRASSLTIFGMCMPLMVTKFGMAIETVKRLVPLPGGTESVRKDTRTDMHPI
jgi:hypothetical protein